MKLIGKKDVTAKQGHIFKLSIRTIMVSIFLLLTIAVSVITAYLSFRYSAKSAELLVAYSSTKLNSNIQEEITDYFMPPDEINNMNANLIGAHLLDATNQANLMKQFSIQIKAHNSVNSISFGNSSGGIANAGIDRVTNKYYVIYTDKFKSGVFNKYTIDNNGDKTRLITRIPNFDARTRPWYKNAQNKAGVVWSDVYLITTGDDLGITASKAVRDENNQLTGVVCVDLFLSDISIFLESLDLGVGGQAFIMDKNGLLIASSKKDKLFNTDSKNKISSRIKATESESVLIRTTATNLKGKNTDFTNIVREKDFDVILDDKTYLAHVTPFSAIASQQWLIVSVIPKITYMAQVYTNNRITIYLIFVVLLLSIVLAVLLARMISNPILGLDKKVRAISQGEWQSEPIPSRISEIDDLAVEIYRMKTTIQSTIENLSSEITERKQAEKTLSESEENFRLLFDTVDDMIFVGSHAGEIIYSNPAVKKQLGYTADELAKMHILSLNQAEQRAEAEAIFEALFKGELNMCPLPLQHKNGSLIPMENRVWAGKWSGVDCVFCISKDLTQEQENLQKFQLLFENNPSPMALNSFPDMKFTDVNNAWLKLLGFTRAEVIGKTDCELDILMQAGKQEELAHQLLTTGAISNVELHAKRKDGTMVTGIFSGELIEQRGEKFFLTGMVDITERKKTELLLQDIIDKNPISIQIVDAEGYTVLSNAACVKLFGNAPPPEFCVFDDFQIKQQGQEELLQKAKSGEVVFLPDMYYNIREFNPDFPDKPIWIKVVIFPIKKSDGTPERFVMMHEDITLRKLAEKTLIAAKESAEESDRLKSSFLANMSHELRTPLSGILGFSELLRAQLQNEDNREMADMIHASGSRLLNTLNLVLDLSRIEANMQEIHRTTIDVNKLLSSVVKLFEPVAVKKGLKLTFVPDNPKLFMLSDSYMLEHIFNELISNAIKYTDTGSVTILTNILIAEEDSRLVIEVRDTGIGIPMDNQAAAFDAFRQVSEGWGRSFEGTGLGLTICKKYVTMLGGEIMLESDLGCGSRFSVSFPADILQPEPGINTTDSNLTPSEAASGVAKQQLPKILLVDDDDMTHILVTQMLRGVVEIDYAATGAEGIMLLTGNTYAVVLLDINLKAGLSGFDVLKEIRKLPKYNGIPIIAITAYAMMGDKEVFLSQGFTDYLSKPFTGNRLSGIIQKWL